MSMGPSPPSPSAGISAGTQAAQAQMPFSEASQAASMIGQKGPTGSLQYVQSGTGPGGVPLYTAVTKLTPQQQQLLNTLQGTQQTGGTQAGQLLAASGYGNMSPSTAIGDLTGGLVGQMMGQETSFLQPFFNTQTSQLDTQLRNQGFHPGDLAYDNAMRSNRTSQGLQVNQFLASAFPMEQQQATTQYELPMQMAESLGGFGAPQSPTTGFTSALPGFTAPNTAADYATASNSAYQQWAAQQAQQSAMLQGLFGIGAAGLKALPTGGVSLGPGGLY
jgi:hypothetical protein